MTKGKMDAAFLKNVARLRGLPESADLSNWVTQIRHLLNVPEHQELSEFLAQERSQPPASSFPVRLVRNAFITHTQEQDIKQLVEGFAPCLSSWWQGIFSFFLFTREAERFVRQTQDCRANTAATASLNQHLQQAASTGVLQIVYQLDMLGKDSPQLTLSSVGSRHYVIKMKDGNQCLRLLKPYLFDITGLAESNERKYELTSYTKAQPLRSYAEQYLAPEASTGHGLSVGMPPRQLDHVLTIVKRLCAALRDAAANGRPHLNVVPDNIDVLCEYDDISGIRLNDPGYDKLSNGKLGSVRAHTLAAVFSAPEVRRDPDTGSSKSDAYSIGIILLELLTQHELTLENIDDSIYDLWRTHPELAVIVEDLMQSERHYRLYGAPDDCRVFDDIVKRLGKHIEIDADATPTHGVTLALKALDSVGPIHYIAEMYRKAKRLRGAGIPAAPLTRRTYTAIVAETLHLFTIFMFLNYIFWDEESLYREFRRCCVDGISVDQLGLFWQSTPAQAFWGRLVALSFSHVCVKYFILILGGINASTVPDRSRGWISTAQLDWTIRIACCAIWWAAILYTMLMDPHKWPYCSAIGMLSVWLLNEWLYRILEEGATRLRHSPFRLVENFKEWKQSAFFYTIMLLVGGLLLQYGILRDEWMYALIVSIFWNFRVMGRHALKMDGPVVKATFDRIVARKDFDSRKPEHSDSDTFLASA